MLALPAQSGRLRQRFFHHGRSVDEYLDLAAQGGDQPSCQRLELLLDQVVIIVALRIDRDRAACPPRENIKRIFVGPVIDAEHDDRAHVAPQRARVGTAIWIGGKPIHRAMCAVGEKLL